MDIQTKRVYKPAKPGDGLRVLVDRLWPRGMAKARVGAGLWLKGAAPSTALRKWFGHDPAKWKAFKSRYFTELAKNSEGVGELLAAAGKGRLTLLFSAKDSEHNQAVALKEYLLSNAKTMKIIRAKNFTAGKAWGSMPIAILWASPVDFPSLLAGRSRHSRITAI